VIERVLAAAGGGREHGAHPEIAAYARIIAARRAETGHPHAYPGSPLIAVSRLRAQDRAVLIELQPDEASALERALPRGSRAQVVHADGFERLKAFLPPPERRGLILMDPPYEETRHDYARIDAALAEALRRFATGVIAVWYPIKDARDIASWQAGLRRSLAREALVSELWLHPCDSRVALNGSGLLIVNPPFGIAERMRAWLPDLLALIGGGDGERRGAGTSVRLL
jgi:23S rRNA (adenine2030-N6)-methyltransferase